MKLKYQHLEVIRSSISSFKIENPNCTPTDEIKNLATIFFAIGIKVDKTLETMCGTKKPFTGSSRPPHPNGQIKSVKNKFPAP